MIFFLYIFVHGRASSLVCLKRHNSSGFCDSKAAGNMLKSAGFRGEVKKKNLTLQPKLSGFLVKLSRFYVLVGGLFVKFFMKNLTRVQRPTLTSTDAAWPRRSGRTRAAARAAGARRPRGGTRG